ncbi:MAG: SDR family oxidoreductase [Bacteroidales bacterium]|jgi:NAD(P)-dependent dehydrogenase (short-subunit alcohol dehydrogenase family)|nr:SDR family oxidoreductase [Bacteroidales bacterium]
MNDFSDLRGKVAAITGGSGIIGMTLVKGLCSAGVTVIILDVKPERGAATAEEMTARPDCGLAVSVAADVTDRESLIRARDQIRERFGSLDILINCAGGNKASATTKKEIIGIDRDLAGSFFELDIEGFDGVFDLNFKGTVLPTMILAEDMVKKGSGSVLNISSMNAYRPLTKIPAYSAAKAAINNFTQWLAVHFAPAGVRVNAIAPGFLLTNQNRFLLTDEQTGEMTPRGRKIISATPMGRYAEPEELVGTMLYLLSETSSFVTGVVIPIDGGFSAYSGV